MNLSIRIVARALLFFAIGVFPTVGLAESESKDALQVSVKSNVEQARPGESFHVVVSFALKPGWHIYWRNPGDAGLPTRIQMDPPEGFSVGELKWPIPKKFMQPGDITGFGYEKEATFLLPVTVSSGVAVGSSHNLPLRISWLLCSNTVCVPGKTEETVAVTVAETTRRVDALAVSEYNYAMTDNDPAFDSRVTVNFAGKKLPMEARVKVIWPGAPSAVSRYLYLPKGVTYREATVEQVEGSTNYHFTFLPKGGQQVTAGTGELMIVGDFAVEREAFSVSIPINGE